MTKNHFRGYVKPLVCMVQVFLAFAIWLTAQKTIVLYIPQELLEAGDGPVALIFVPTRELALDTKAQCDLYGWHCTIVGGTPPRQQREWLEDKNDIVAVWLTLCIVRERNCDSRRLFPHFSFAGF